MAQTYTLDEAADRLGVPVDEFKKKLRDEWKTLRSFRDGPTQRFRASDIDELARTLGAASDPGLQLGPVGSPAQPGSSDEILLADDGSDPGPADDIFSMAAGDSGKGKKKPKGDSDVRLEHSKKRRKADPEQAIPTEEINLDLSDPGSDAPKSGLSSSRLRAPKSGPNLAGPESATKIPGPGASAAKSDSDSSSEFELSLDADSGSFELQLNDSSEEVALGGTPAGNKGGQSGINLGRPADSGVNLEKKGKKAADEDSSDDFELSLDPSDSEIPAPKSKKKLAAASTDSSSEFELTLDDNSGITDGLVAEADENKGDIFETDFELPVMQDDAESGSEVVAVESSDTDLENSDFDLALDESDAPAGDDSESQVVTLDDDSEDAPAARPAAGPARKKVNLYDDEDDAGAALAGVSRRTADDEDDDRPVRVAPPAKWGALPVAVLAPSLIISFLGMIMAYELISGVVGYQQGRRPGATIVRGVASMLDMDPKD